MDINDANNIFGQLKGEYDLWVPQWKELASYLAPTSGSFDDDAKSKQGQKLTPKRYWILRPAGRWLFCPPG